MDAPRATYRLQLSAEFGLREARALVPYLRDLGLSHVYTSPVLRARSGSTHGYDVIDPTRVDPALGGLAELRLLAADLAEQQMGLLLDVVPNHMAASEEGPWWADLLEHGRASEYAPVFDVHWRAAEHGGTLADQLLLPILGLPYAQALAERTLHVVLQPDGIALRVHDRNLPTDPGTWGPLVRAALDPEHPQVQAAIALAEAMPSRANGRRDRVSRARLLRERLGDLLAAEPALRSELAAWLAQMSPAEVHAFVDAQAYQPVHWKLATEIPGYRRFFDINDLVAVRVHDPDVFLATHALLLGWAEERLVSGFRIDHIDGMRDPAGYLEQLRARAPDTYVVVEKILSGGESLPADWPVAGTTGYEFGNAASGVFVDRAGLDALVAIYRRFTGDTESWAGLCFRLGVRVLDELFGGERDRLARWLHRIAAATRTGLDLSPRALREALTAVTAGMPVYRTYIRQAPLSAQDQQALQQAFAQARRWQPQLDERALDFLRSVLSLEPWLGGGSGAAEPLPDEVAEFVAAWQQLTGPVKAKAVEDTALYRWTPHLSLNAIGAEPDPDPHDLTIAAFHAHNARVQRDWPHTLLATSTHDSKRSEDVRCRLHALAELPRTSERTLLRLHKANRARFRDVGGRRAPDPQEEVLLYQTLLGAWPLAPQAHAEFPRRIAAYLIKAAREAKRNTSWLRPDEEYERALVGFVEDVLDPRRGRAFRSELERMHARLAPLGAWYSLALLALKLASPGVPDFYRGCELWQFRLVDPDNREPVDFDLRRRLLASLRTRAADAELAQELVRNWPDGRIKLWVMLRGLRLRRQRAELFASGEYLPLAVQGARRAQVCAFARRHGRAWMLCAVPARIASFVRHRPPLGQAVWRDTAVRLPRGAPAVWHDALTDRAVRAVRGQLPLAELLRHLPVALLAADADGGDTPPP